MNIQAREVSAPSIHSRDVAVANRPTHTHELVHVVTWESRGGQNVVFYNAYVAGLVGSNPTDGGIGFRLPVEADGLAFADAFLAGYAEPVTLERLIIGGYGQSAVAQYDAQYDEQTEFEGVALLVERGLIEPAPAREVDPSAN